MEINPAKLKGELIREGQGHRLCAVGSEQSDEFKEVKSQALAGTADSGEWAEVYDMLKGLRRWVQPIRDVRLDPDFSRVVASGVALQQHLPWMELIAVGGTAAALHAGHRVSYDVDFVSRNLRGNFAATLAAVTEWSEWTTNRSTPDKIILGEYNAVKLGIRQAFRQTPIQTIEKQGLRIPTLPECFKIKAYLVCQRGATRDFVDACALFDQLPPTLVGTLFAEMDKDYPSDDQLSRATHFAAAVRLGPKDEADVELSSYKQLHSPYNNLRGYILPRLEEVSRVALGKRLGKGPDVS